MSIITDCIKTLIDRQVEDYRLVVWQRRCDPRFAPLPELVPWKEAKKYWDELVKGKYEWSSIGKQLREKGLVKP